MRLTILLSFLLIALTASAGTVSRLYDFEPGTKAEADKVDAEFDNIISTINGNIDSTNILDGGIATADLGSNSVTTAKMSNSSVTLLKMATGANGYIKDYRHGCNPVFDSSVTQSVKIDTPCQVIIDGWYGQLAAQASGVILDSGTMAGNNVYYVYGAVNGQNSVDFEFSAATPNTITFRKPSDSTKRYLGSFITNNAAAILNFKRIGGRIYHGGGEVDSSIVSAGSPTVGSILRTNGGAFSVNVTTSPQALNVPPFATRGIGSAFPTISFTSGAAQGYCYLTLVGKDGTGRTDRVRYFANVVTGSSAEQPKDFPMPTGIPIFNKIAYSDGVVCTSQFGPISTSGWSITLTGWEEPPELY